MIYRPQPNPWCRRMAERRLKPAHDERMVRLISPSGRRYWALRHIDINRWTQTSPPASPASEAAPPS
jgi:hypothetical protein